MKIRNRITLAGGLCAILVVSGCGTMPTGRDRIVKAPQACADVAVQIYFEPESAQVTREGRAVLKAAAAQAKGCKVEAVSVVGLADAAGAPDANLALSNKRAEAVQAALKGMGLPAASFETTAVGQAGSVTAAGDARPLRRRADITLKLAR